MVWRSPRDLSAKGIILEIIRADRYKTEMMALFPLGGDFRLYGYSGWPECSSLERAKH
jgi:hypothetical protein